MKGPERHVIVGTAGHIDHGKTSLVKRLTGIDTDRLPEEQARGISIDLGFAHFDVEEFHFGLVDVPGHERFVKNMVAGATGVDLALLVVAADDGVMPQTREHLEIMDLLGVSAGVIAVTKIDLVDPDFLELVKAEVGEQVRGTFLEGAPIVPVSSQTGAGIDRLKEALVQVAREREWSSRGELFRMPIDRVFSIAGHGTVVTGSVMGGEVRAGDTLELLPGQAPVRVRSVQSHGELVNESGARRRTAINLAGIKTDEVHRGQELAAPGYLRPTRRMLVSVRCLSSSPLALRDRMQLALHLGTAETTARVILKGMTIEPGETGYAELRLAKPIVAAWGQRYILRRASPPLTVAGGVILDPGIDPRRRIPDLAARAAPLESADDEARLAAFVAERDQIDSSPLVPAWKVGISPARYAGLLAKLSAQGVLIPLGPRDSKRLVHRSRLDAVAAAVEKRIRLELQAHQPRRALPRRVLQTACQHAGPAELVEAAFEKLLKERKLVRIGENIGPADAQVQLSKSQLALRAKLLEQIGQAGLTPPNLKELAQVLGQKPEQIQTLLTLCVEDGLLVDIGDGLHYPPAALERARAICQSTFAQHGGATMSQLREAWGVTRKYSVPLCEWFDAHHLTTRAGDLRHPGPELAKPLAE
ncbi:MAG: selenocysteine-specific translation elongation factor [Deltaproteobacteria bacterium]